MNSTNDLGINIFNEYINKTPQTDEAIVNEVEESGVNFSNDFNDVERNSSFAQDEAIEQTDALENMNYEENAAIANSHSDSQIYQSAELPYSNSMLPEHVDNLQEESDIDGYMSSYSSFQGGGGASIDSSIDLFRETSDKTASKKMKKKKKQASVSENSISTHKTPTKSTDIDRRPASRAVTTGGGSKKLTPIVPGPARTRTASPTKRESKHTNSNSVSKHKSTGNMKNTIQLPPLQSKDNDKQNKIKKRSADVQTPNATTETILPGQSLDILHPYYSQLVSVIYKRPIVLSILIARKRKSVFKRPNPPLRESSQINNKQTVDTSSAVLDESYDSTACNSNDEMPNEQQKTESLRGPKLKRYFTVKVYDLVDSKEASYQVSLIDFNLLLNELCMEYGENGHIVNDYYQPNSAPWWAKHIAKLVLVYDRPGGVLSVLVDKKLIRKHVKDKMKHHSWLMDSLQVNPVVNVAAETIDDNNFYAQEQPLNSTENQHMESDYVEQHEQYNYYSEQEQSAVEDTDVNETSWDGQTDNVYQQPEHYTLNDITQQQNSEESQQLNNIDWHVEGLPQLEQQGDVQSSVEWIYDNTQQQQIDSNGGLEIAEILQIEALEQYTQNTTLLQEAHVQVHTPEGTPLQNTEVFHTPQHEYDENMQYQMTSEAELSQHHKNDDMLSVVYSVGDSSDIANVQDEHAVDEDSSLVNHEESNPNTNTNTDNASDNITKADIVVIDDTAEYYLNDPSVQQMDETLTDYKTYTSTDILETSYDSAIDSALESGTESSVQSGLKKKKKTKKRTGTSHLKKRVKSPIQSPSEMPLFDNNISVITGFSAKNQEKSEEKVLFHNIHPSNWNDSLKPLSPLFGGKSEHSVPKKIIQSNTSKMREKLNSETRARNTSPKRTNSRQASTPKLTSGNSNSKTAVTSTTTDTATTAVSMEDKGTVLTTDTQAADNKQTDQGPRKLSKKTSNGRMNSTEKDVSLVVSSDKRVSDVQRINSGKQRPPVHVTGNISTIPTPVDNKPVKTEPPRDVNLLKIALNKHHDDTTTIRRHSTTGNAADERKVDVSTIRRMSSAATTGVRIPIRSGTESPVFVHTPPKSRSASPNPFGSSSVSKSRSDSPHSAGHHRDHHHTMSPAEKHLHDLKERLHHYDLVNAQTYNPHLAHSGEHHVIHITDGHRFHAKVMDNHGVVHVKVAHVPDSGLSIAVQKDRSKIHRNSDTHLHRFSSHSTDGIATLSAENSCFTENSDYQRELFVNSDNASANASLGENMDLEGCFNTHTEAEPDNFSSTMQDPLLTCTSGTSQDNLIASVNSAFESTLPELVNSDEKIKKGDKKKKKMSKSPSSSLYEPKLPVLKVSQEITAPPRSVSPPRCLSPYHEENNTLKGSKKLALSIIRQVRASHTSDPSYKFKKMSLQEMKLLNSPFAVKIYYTPEEVEAMNQAALKSLQKIK